MNVDERITRWDRFRGILASGATARSSFQAEACIDFIQIRCTSSTSSSILWRIKRSMGTTHGRGNTTENKTTYWENDPPVGPFSLNARFTPPLLFLLFAGAIITWLFVADTQFRRGNQKAIATFRQSGKEKEMTRVVPHFLPVEEQSRADLYRWYHTDGDVTAWRTTANFSLWLPAIGYPWDHARHAYASPKKGKKSKRESKGTGALWLCPNCSSSRGPEDKWGSQVRQWRARLLNVPN